jgi:hypothetical protein
MEDEHLGGAAPPAQAAEPGGADPGVVDDEEVAAAEQGGEVAEGAVLGRALGREVEEPRGVALVERPLRDPRRRQRIVEVGGRRPRGAGGAGAGQSSSVCTAVAPAPGTPCGGVSPRWR